MALAIVEVGWRNTQSRVGLTDHCFGVKNLKRWTRRFEDAIHIRVEVVIFIAETLSGFVVKMLQSEAVGWFDADSVVQVTRQVALRLAFDRIFVANYAVAEQVEEVGDANDLSFNTSLIEKCVKCLACWTIWNGLTTQSTTIKILKRRTFLSTNRSRKEQNFHH